MNTKAIAFTASEQTLVKTSGADAYASNTVGYIEATFDLDTNWDGFDSVRAVWKSQYYTISAVLDAYGKCLVPAEVKYYKSKVFVNLVGSNVEDDVLVDRLTTYPVLAFTIDAEAEVEGTETTDITPSQFEQFVDQVEGYADAAADSADDAAAAVASLAPAYSSSSTYAVGDYVMHEGVMYECTTAITTAEAWNAAHWTAVAIATEISDLKEDIADKSNWTVGAAEQLVSDDASQTDVTPYTFRRSGGGLIPFNFTREELNKVVGGTVAWNQLVNIKKNYTATSNGATVTTDGDGLITLTVNSGRTLNSVFTLTDSAVPIIANHVIAGGETTGALDSYYDYASGTYWGLTSGSTRNAFGVVKPPSGGSLLGLYVGTNVPEGTYKLRYIASDLTAMLASTIADYIYGLDASARVPKLREWGFFTDSYYSYDPGSLQSVCVGAHECVGFNQWDEEWEVGTISANGQASPSTTVIRNKYTDPIKVLPSTEYYFYCGNTSAKREVHEYRADGSHIKYTVFNGNGTFTTSADCKYIRFVMYSAYGTTYNHDICINLSDATRNGEYQPYQKHTYPLDSTKTLRGLFKLDSNNNLYCDGDEYLPSGEIARTYGEYTFTGSETWTWFASSQFWYMPLTGVNTLSNKIKTSNGIVVKSNSQNQIRVYVSDNPSISENTNMNTVFSNGTAIVYSLITPTTETADQYTAIQICDSDGTEEFVDALVEAGTRDVAIPAGHETVYYEDMAGKLAELPPIPSAPSANGTYTLQAVVSSGAVTYQWTS